MSKFSALLMSELLVFEMQEINGALFSLPFASSTVIVSLTKIYGSL